MHLHYLDFDSSDDDAGGGSYDAMATLAPGRLPALLAEIGAVLRWARSNFGPPGAPPEDGDWDYALQAQAEPGPPLDVRVDDAAGVVTLAPAPQALATVTFTLGGTPAFCDAFRQAFTAAE